MIDPDPRKRKKPEGWKLRMVKKFLLANPEATILEICRACRTSASTASRARKILLETGQLEPAITGRPVLPEVPPVPGELPVDVEEIIRRDIEAAIASGAGKILTREERRQRLSAYADHPKVPHAAKIAALKELEATEPADSGPALGPGPPLTRPDRIHRVALMMEALIDIEDLDAVYEALSIANPPPETEDAITDGPSPTVDDSPRSEE